MATRRARIKTTALILPTRRKNNDQNDKNKPKDEVSHPAKSPRTAAPKSAEAISSPSNNITTPTVIKTPQTLHNKDATSISPRLGRSPHNQCNIKSPQNLIRNSNRSTTSPASPINKTPQLDTIKVSVITSTASFKQSLGTFASPLRKDNDKRVLLSPSPNLISRSIGKRQETIDGISSTLINTSNAENSNIQISQKNQTDFTSSNSTDETVMDGIVPLQPTKNVPKPIDLLKSEIISENAEVLFDPIVPLPSPSKVRPKLRPVPRLAPLRRNSIQGSASESEDESRRLLASGGTTPALARQRHDSHTSHSTMQSTNIRDLNRTRNDSICSSISQQAPQATSPQKEKHHISKARRQEMNSRRQAAMRRRREGVKPDTLTMYDLIFYNPTTNPIVPDQDEVNAKAANAKDASNTAATTGISTTEAAAEETADDPPESAPVPQIKLGPNGEIVLDETSLVIKQTGGNRKLTSVVREGSWGGFSGRYTRATRTAEWSDEETVRFYRALAAVGTDFTMMTPMFPKRTRKDLKLKFKKEERLNGAQVDKALRSATTWDASRLKDEFNEERAEAAKREQRERERIEQFKQKERERLKAARQLGLRTSKAAKALESTAQRVVRKQPEQIATADEIVEHHNKVLAKANNNINDPQTIPSTPPINKEFAILSRLPKNQDTNTKPIESHKDFVTITKTNTTQKVDNDSIASVAMNIEKGSLVVLTVNDPNSPSKKMLQTYISHGPGNLTPIALPPHLLNSVVGYLKNGKGTPKSIRSNISSPQLTSPSSVASCDSRTSTSLLINPSPQKRERHSSYSITQL